MKSTMTCYLLRSLFVVSSYFVRTLFVYIRMNYEESTNKLRIKYGHGSFRSRLVIIGIPGYFWLIDEENDGVEEMVSLFSAMRLLYC
jgi:hypothetical protein